MNGRDPFGGLAPELAGGTPELWRSYMSAAPVNVLRPFPSAPDRALLESVLRLSGLRRGQTVAELGCGSSAFLPRMGEATGARVAGTDFSSEGLERTRGGLRQLGLDDSGLALAAIADYVPEHENEFDVVVSFGLVEHFADLYAIVADHFRCAKAGGIVCIAAPNLSRVNLAWVKATAPSLLDWHRPIDAAEVAHVVGSCGGTDLKIEYRGGLRLFAHPDRSVTARVVRKCVNAIGEASYRAASGSVQRVAGAWFSPFFVVAATRPLRR
jgi:SAM-dependent methyltransferase